METKQLSQRNASFTCQRTDLSNALKILGNTKLRVTTVATSFAEHKIYLKTDMLELPVTCIDPKGTDVTFSILITLLKKYCRFTPEKEYHFVIKNDELQINSTIFNVK